MSIYLITPTCYCEGFISRHFATSVEEIKRIVRDHAWEYFNEMGHDIRVDLDNGTVKWTDDNGDETTYHIHEFTGLGDG